MNSARVVSISLLLVAALPLFGQQEPADAGKTARPPGVRAALVTALGKGDPQSLNAVAQQIHKEGKAGRELLRAMLERVAPVAQALPAVDPAQKPDAKVLAEPLADAVRGQAETLLGDDAAAADAVAAELKTLAASAGNAIEVRKLAMRADALLTGYVAALFREQEETRALFAGQYNALLDLGPSATRLLLGWMEKPPPRVPAEQFKVHCIRALRDVAGQKPDAAVLARVKKVASDKIESRLVAREAGFALAQFGDRSLVEPKIAALQEQAKGVDAAARARALAELADFHYQLREFKTAADMYRQHLALAETDQAVAAATTNLATVYYNACCSMALAGQLDDAFAFLDKAVAAGKKLEKPLARRMLEVDMDIVTLRKDPRFAQVLERLGAGKQP